MKLLNKLWIVKNALYSILRKTTVGVRAIVLKDGKFLLVKHTYLPHWYLVGGGVDPGEGPNNAIQRELLEEVGISCEVSPKLFSIYHSQKEGRDDYIILYTIKNFSMKPVSSPEIDEIQWVDPQELPSDISPSTKKRIEEYLGDRVMGETW